MKLAATRSRLSVPQSRAGRRPISVANFLKKDKEGTLFKEAFDPLLAILARACGGGDLQKLAENLGTNSAGFKLQGRTNFQGLPVAIENKPGSVRSGKNPDGTKWQTKFKLPYGYIEGTKGGDNEEIDAYVGPHITASHAHVVHQKNPDGSHDEDTVMLGFKTPAAARTAILDHYDDPKHLGGVTSVPMDKLRALLFKPKKLEKIAGVTDQGSLQVPIGNYPGVTERPADPRKRLGDTPSREDAPDGLRVSGPSFSPQTVLSGSFLAPAAQSELSKVAAPLPLGDARRPWEGPSAEGEAPFSSSWFGAAPDPSETARTARIQSPTTEQAVLQGVQPSGLPTKMSAATRPRAEDNTVDIQAIGNSIQLPGGAAPTDEFSKTARFFYAAFFDELEKCGGISKEAFFGDAMASMRARSARPAELRGTWGGNNTMSSTLHEGGQMLRGPATSGMNAADTATAQAIRPTSAARRITGETAMGAGHHMQHTGTLKAMTNPLGAPVGGAMEGFTRGVGKELQRGTGSIAQRVGAGLVKHAPKAGIAGEIGALGTVGGLIHAPLNIAGHLGGAVAPMLGHAGIAGHVAQDAVGTAVQQGAGKFLGRAAGLAGKALPMMGKLLPKFAAEITPEQAQDSARHLRELNRTKPSASQLGRGAAVGAVVGPAAAILSKSIGGTWKKDLKSNLRELAASSVSGATFGGLVPHLRHQLEHKAETGRLQKYVNQQKTAGLFGDAMTHISGKVVVPKLGPSAIAKARKVTQGLGGAAPAAARRAVVEPKTWDVSAMAAKMGLH